MKRYDIKKEAHPAESAVQSGNKTEKEIHNEYLCLVLNERSGIERLEDAQGNSYLLQAWDFLSV